MAQFGDAVLLAFGLAGEIEMALRLAGVGAGLEAGDEALRRRDLAAGDLPGGESGRRRG